MHINIGSAFFLKHAPLAIAIIVLGYAQHDRIISLLGILLLPVALFQITRRLDLGLMDTGIILMIKSGLVLIVYFVYKTWAFTTNDENQDFERKA